MKKAWVDKQKLKSKWKAEKRREGLGTVPTRPGDDLVESLDDDDASNNSEAEDNPTSEKDLPGPSKTPPATVEAPPWSAGGNAKEKGKRKARDPPSRPQGEDNKVDLRELRKQAYAASSLHSHKADPLHRRTGQPRGRGQSVGRGGRGRGSHGRDSDVRGGGRGGGRGQPDMRLRMNMMLEQIKQNYT